MKKNILYIIQFVNFLQYLLYNFLCKYVMYKSLCITFICINHSLFSIEYICSLTSLRYVG